MTKRISSDALRACTMLFALLAIWIYFRSGPQASTTRMASSCTRSIFANLVEDTEKQESKATSKEERWDVSSILKDDAAFLGTT